VIPIREKAHCIFGRFCCCCSVGYYLPQVALSVPTRLIFVSPPKHLRFCVLHRPVTHGQLCPGLPCTRHVLSCSVLSCPALSCLDPSCTSIIALPPRCTRLSELPCCTSTLQGQGWRIFASCCCWLMHAERILPHPSILFLTLPPSQCTSVTCVATTATTSTTTTSTTTTATAATTYTVLLLCRWLVPAFQRLGPKLLSSSSFTSPVDFLITAC
jgi:hypothetical protein